MKKIALSKTDSTTLDASRVLTNDVVLDGEYNPHNVSLWLVLNEYGALAAVWAGNEQDALDLAVDEGLLDSCSVEGPVSFDEKEQGYFDEDGAAVTLLGNAGEPFYLDNIGMRRVPQSDMPVNLLVAFAEARGAGASTLEDVTSAYLACIQKEV